MANQGSGSQQKAKCAHGPCTCLVEPSQSYCSEHCAKEGKGATSADLPGGKHAGGGCACGHPDCEGMRA